MRKYIIKRILQSIVILFFVSFIIYALMRCLPTSYVENMARQKSMQPGSKSFEEWMEQLTAAYNMDRGIILGFFGLLAACNLLNALLSSRLSISSKQTGSVQCKQSIRLHFILPLLLNFYA